MVRKRIVVHGRVQGVGFRISARMRADELGITGYVGNRRDGTVEAEIEGEPEVLSTMVEWFHAGPELAHVTGIEVEELAPRDSSTFVIE